jgi:hypothetical protein
MITVHLFQEVIDDLRTGERHDTRELLAILEEFDVQMEPAPVDPDDDETKTQFLIRPPSICGNTLLQLLTQAAAVERIYARSEKKKKKKKAASGGCGMGGMTALFVGGGGGG